MLVSFDVSSLFTNVPIGEAMVIQAKLREDDDLVERIPPPPDRVTEHVLEIYFLQLFYEQREGAAIGSSSLQW